MVAFRFVWSAGNATFTTVPSMNAMLEARVVAASTHGPKDLGQGAVAGRERIMLASQGSWMNAGMAAANNRQTSVASHGFSGASRGNATIGTERPEPARRGEGAPPRKHDVAVNIRKRVVRKQYNQVSRGYAEAIIGCAVARAFGLSAQSPPNSRRFRQADRLVHPIRRNDPRQRL